MWVGQLLGAARLLSVVEGTHSKGLPKAEGEADTMAFLGLAGSVSPRPAWPMYRRDRVMTRAWTWLALRPGCLLLAVIPWAS